MTGRHLAPGLAAAVAFTVGALAAADPAFSAEAQSAATLSNFSGAIDDGTEAQVRARSCAAPQEQITLAQSDVVKALTAPPREGSWAGRLVRGGRCAGFADQRVRAEVRGDWTEIEVVGYGGSNHVFEAELSPGGVAKASQRLGGDYIGVNGQFDGEQFTGSFFVTPGCRAKITMSWAHVDLPFAPDFEGRFNGRWIADAGQCGGEVSLLSRRGRLTGLLGEDGKLLGEIRRNGEIEASGDGVSLRGQIFPGGAAGELEFERGSCRTRAALSPRFGMFAKAPTVIKSLDGAPASGKAPARVPLIVVPGLLGSTLVDANDPDTLVWGDLEQTFEDFTRLTLEPPGEASRLKPQDILRELRTVSIAGTRKFYGHLLERLTELGYQEGRDLFAFYYDWRRSNFETADQLAAFIADQGLADREVDIIAHSMGGIVTRLYLDRHAETQRVRKFVAMAVPHYGSMNAITALFAGADYLGLAAPVVVGAGDKNSITRVFWSFESIYELMPTYPNCCFVRLGGHLEPFDPADPAAWRSYSWLIPEPAREAGTLAVMDRSLQRLQQIRAVMAKPLPDSVESHALVNSEVADTEIQIALHWDGIGRHEPLCGAGGDGTVPALSQYDGIPAERHIRSRRTHQTIFNDDAVWLRLSNILAPGPGSTQ